MHKIVEENGAVLHKGRKNEVLNAWDDVRRKCNFAELQPGHTYILMNGKEEIARATCTSQEEIQKHKAEYAINSLKIQVQGFVDSAQNEIERFESDLREAKEKGVGYSYVLHWQTATVFHCERLLQRASSMVEQIKIIEAQKHGESIVEVWKAMTEYVEAFEDGIAETMSRASWANKSTSPLANVENDEQSSADAKFWNTLRNWVKWHGSNATK